MSLDYLDPAHPVTSGKVTLEVGGFDYFSNIELVIGNLTAGDTLLLMNWSIQSEFHFSPGEPIATQRKLLLKTLHEAVFRGVDVRVLVWVNTNLFEPLYPIEHNSDFVSDIEDISSNAGNIEEALTGQQRFVPALEDEIYKVALSVDRDVRNNDSLLFKDVMQRNLIAVDEWRKSFDGGSTPMQNRVVINTLDSTFGGCHAKFAVALKQTSNGVRGQAFTGGIDFVLNRYSLAPYRPSASGLPNYWHDIMAIVEGSDAVAPMYELFKTLWNANIDRKNTYNPNITAVIQDQTYNMDCVPAAATHLENKTFDPNHNFDSHKLQSIVTIPDTFQLFGTAANPGIGEPQIPTYANGKFSYRDAIVKAFEKAEFYIYIEDQAMQSLEIHAMAAAAVKRSPTLRVIMMRGGDPSDSARPIADKLIKRDHYDSLTDSEKERFILYDANYTVHSKLFLIDDRVAIVGSGGHFTRSLTEELEHGIAYIDDSSTGSTSLAALRQQLWQIHTGIDFSQAPYDDLANALQVWDSPPSDFGDINDNGVNTGTELTRLDWDTQLLTPFPNVESDIANLLNIAIPLAEDIPPQFLPAQSDYLEYIKEQAQIFLHMTMFEWPYQSWHNPLSLPAGAVLPKIDQKSVPVNVAATMALEGPASNQVVWEYIPADGLTTFDAAADSFVGSGFSVRFRTPGMKLVVATVSSSTFTAARKVPFIIQVLENSGPDWINRYPKSTDLLDLSEDFREKVIKFLNNLVEAGIPYTGMRIVTTYRPPERAFLMASSYQITRRGASPDSIPQTLPHIPISWVHHDLTGAPDLPASKAAAIELFNAYGIPGKAAYPSEHMRREAIDMVIEITSPVLVNFGNGRQVLAASQSDLAPVAEAFGIHYMSNSNHWSSNGR